MPRQQLTTFSPTGFFDTFQQACQEYKWVLQIARVSFVIHKIQKRRGKVKKRNLFLHYTYIKRWLPSNK
jgi:hypothetical protein